MAYDRRQLLVFLDILLQFLGKRLNSGDFLDRRNSADYLSPMPDWRHIHHVLGIALPSVYSHSRFPGLGHLGQHAAGTDLGERVADNVRFVQAGDFQVTLIHIADLTRRIHNQHSIIDGLDQTLYPRLRRHDQFNEFRRSIFHVILPPSDPSWNGSHFFIHSNQNGRQKQTRRNSPSFGETVIRKEIIGGGGSECPDGSEPCVLVLY